MVEYGNVALNGSPVTASKAAISIPSFAAERATTANFDPIMPTVVGELLAKYFSGCHQSTFPVIRLDTRRCQSVSRTRPTWSACRDRGR